VTILPGTLLPRENDTKHLISTNQLTDTDIQPGANATAPQSNK